MQFTLLVYGPPFAGQSAQSALRFARSAVGGGHGVSRVFFYHDGAFNGAAAIIPPQDEPDLRIAWQTLNQEAGVDLVICISTALRRGVLDAREASRNDRPVTLAPGFRLAGLGELVEAINQDDRLLTFAE